MVGTAERGPVALVGGVYRGVVGLVPAAGVASSTG